MSQARASLLMLVALLPMIIYMGHWHTSELIASVVPGAHSHAGHVHPAADPQHDEHEHSQHCHGALASCSEMPYTGSATILMLGAALIALALGLLRWRQPARELNMPFGTSFAPISPPPRPSWSPSRTFR